MLDITGLGMMDFIRNPQTGLWERREERREEQGDQNEDFNLRGYLDERFTHLGERFDILEAQKDRILAWQEEVNVWRGRVDDQLKELKNLYIGQGRGGDGSGPSGGGGFVNP